LSQAGTLEKLALFLSQALQGLQPRLAPDQIEAFLCELGIGVPAGLGAEAQFAGAAGDVVTELAAVIPMAASLVSAIASENVAGIISAAGQVIDQIAKIFTAFSQAATALHNAASAAMGLTAAQIANLQNLAAQLGRKLLDYAIIEGLRTQSPGLVATLNVIGVIDDDLVPGTQGDLTSPPFHARVLHLERVLDLFTKPQQYLQETIGWGTATFDGSILFTKLYTLFQAANLPGMPIFASGQPPAFEAFLLRLSPDTTTNPPGLLANFRIPATQDFSQNYSLTPQWSLALSAQARFDANLQAKITPPFNVTLSESATISLQAMAGFAAAHSDGTPLVIFGETGGSGLFAKSFGFNAGLQATWDATSNTAAAEPVISVKIAGGSLIIDTSQADGFVSGATSGATVNAAFDLNMSWAPETGVHIDGGAQLEIDLPLHLSIGPVSVPTIYLVGGLSGDGITIELSAALGLVLGPIQASVDRIGVKGLIDFPGSGGNLGPADLSIAFKPPNGLGIDIDAGVAAGGGYISFDPDKGQYAGVLDVSILDTVQVKVIGVIDTVMPDGSSGFAFLLIITFDFPPIQLGFGFTLNGVGGLGGVNRTMSIDALHAGFRAHTLDSILFPPDPVANAPQIISNIRTFFPVAPGRYVFGPMFELGWGTPTLITFALGIILELPDPIRLALLGIIDAGLPTEDEPLIELHIDVLGTLDFGTKTFELDGSLFDSHVLIYSLAGDLLFRLCWGDNPTFIFSLGGFNPNFNTAGLNVPPMNRLSVSIGNGDNPRISANSYFAVTSNSLQFGANVEAYASAGGFAIHGYLGFDVLIIFSPFSFEFDFSAGFDVTYDGASLLGLNVDGIFAGPRPWHLHGDASISVLFITVSASVDLTWGDSTPVTLPAKPVLPDLLAALSASSSWSALLPDNTVQAVSLSTPKPDETALCVHPLGILSVNENVVPLDLAITKYGNATPSDGNYFSISDVEINGQEEVKNSIPGYFATGQFQTLSDADKLSLPSFESYDAGVSIGAAQILNGADSPRTVVYEEYQIDPETRFSIFTRFYEMSDTVHSSLVKQGAGYMSAVKHSALAKFRQGQGAALAPIKTADPAYVITGKDDMAIRSDIATANGTTYFAARAALSAHIALHPEDKVNLQIVPLYEVMA
jgi:hypothetical protein